MASSFITIDGTVIHGDAHQTTSTYLLIRNIIDSGKSEQLIVGSKVDGKDSRLLFLISPRTRVVATVVDNDMEQFARETIDTLTPNFDALFAEYVSLPASDSPAAD